MLLKRKGRASRNWHGRSRIPAHSKHPRRLKPRTPKNAVSPLSYKTDSLQKAASIRGTVRRITKFLMVVVAVHQAASRRPTQLTSAAGAGVVRREVVFLLAAVRKRLAAVRKRLAAAVVGPEAADNSRHPASNADRRGRGDNREGRRKAARTKRARSQPKPAQSPSQRG